MPVFTKLLIFLFFFSMEKFKSKKTREKENHIKKLQLVLIKINNTNYTQNTEGTYESHWAHWTYEIKSIKSTSIKKTKKKHRVKQQCLHWVQHQVVQIRTRHVKAIVKHWIKPRHNFPTLHVGRQKFCHKIFTKFLTLNIFLQCFWI